MDTTIRLIAWFILYLAFNLSLCHGQSEKRSFTKYSISGFVKEMGSQEALPGAVVFIKELNIGTVSNNYGFFSIAIASLDTVTAQVSCIGHETLTLRISKGDHLMHVSQDFELSVKSNLLNEVVVNSDYENEVENQQSGVLKLPIEQAKLLPALLGEKDLLKIFQLMPGIQKATEGTAGLYVRGGGADQNLIILDEATVYNASHLFGFYSIFNGDAIKNMDLYKGGFPARFGGRVSSVVDVRMKEGDRQTFHGEATVGLLSTKVMVEGPLKKNRSSFLFSGRRTYLDLLLKPNFNGGAATYYFYDFNLKFNYDFSSKDKIYLSSYTGKDYGLLIQNTNNFSKQGLNWQNITSTFRWNHLFSQKLFMNTSLIFSNYTYNVSDEETVNNKLYVLNYSSRIRDLSAKIDLDYAASTNQTFKAGFLITHHLFTPSSIVQSTSDTTSDQNTKELIDSNEFGVYLEDEVQMGNFKWNIGTRISGFSVNTKTYMNFEPRLSSVFALPNNWSVKASYTHMTQYVHLLSNSGIGLPTDLWVPTTNRIAPQKGDQVTLGLIKNLPVSKLILSIEVFYKKNNSIIAYKEGSNALLVNGPAGLADEQKNNSWQNRVTIGQGWSRGFELFIQRKQGRLTGWLGYTLSFTQQQFDSLNNGQRFWANYDRRHDISLVGIYRLNGHVNLTGSWVFATGNVYTLPLSTIQLATPQLNPNQQPVVSNATTYGERNNFRAEPYHRMDLGCQFTKKKKHYERIWELSIYNVYGHLNPFLYQVESNIDAQGNVQNTLQKISLFSIIPSLSLKIKF